jgi:hypothetical protein
MLVGVLLIHLYGILNFQVVSNAIHKLHTMIHIQEHVYLVLPTRPTIHQVTSVWIVTVKLIKFIIHWLFCVNLDKFQIQHKKVLVHNVHQIDLIGIKHPFHVHYVQQLSHIIILSPKIVKFVLQTHHTIKSKKNVCFYVQQVNNIIIQL